MMKLEEILGGINVAEIKEQLLGIDGIEDVHHIHLRSIDGHSTCATLHIITDSDTQLIKESARDILKELGITHSTIETEPFITAEKHYF